MSNAWLTAAGRRPEPGPVYYHGHGRDSRASTGYPEWDDNLFVSHDPAVARLYGPDVDRLQMAPGTRVIRYEGMDGKPDYHLRKLREARQAGADVVEFHHPHDFVGHVILNEDKIVSRSPGYQADQEAG